MKLWSTLCCFKFTLDGQGLQRYPKQHSPTASHLSHTVECNLQPGGTSNVSTGIVFRVGDAVGAKVGTLVGARVGATQ